MNFKHILSIILVFVLSFGFCSVAIADETAEIPEGYTPIYTAEDLNNIRNDLDGKYILMNDIDLSEYENWEPIGVSGAPFTGQFNGNNHKVSSMIINREYNGSENIYYGLFGYINGTSNGNEYTIKDLTVLDARINVKCSENEKAKTRTGILVGFSSAATISDCSVEGEINVKDFSVSEVGGIAGRSSWSDFVNCVNYSDINVYINSNSTQISAGGISGIVKQSGEQFCCNYGNIVAVGTDVSESCVVKIGGVDGDGSGNICLADSYNRGDISVDFSNAQTYLGGVSGESYISENVYSSGNIIYPNGFEGYAGAISGNLFYSVLAVGLPSELENAYYIDETNIPAYDGEDIPDDFTQRPFINVKLLTEEEFKNQESFVGFDFENVWKMEENGYPVLQNQPQIALNEDIELEVGEKHPIIPGKKHQIFCDSDSDIVFVEITSNNEILALHHGKATIIVEYAYGYVKEYRITITEKSPIHPVEPPVESTTNPESPSGNCLLADCKFIIILKNILDVAERIIVFIIDFLIIN